MPAPRDLSEHDVSSVSSVRWAEAGDDFYDTHETQARHPEGLAAGRDGSAVRARRLQHLRQLAIVLSRHRRSRDRMHADPRAGDGALRLGRRARRGADRPGLDRGARARRRHDRRARGASPTSSTRSRASARSDGCSPRRRTRRSSRRRISGARRSPPSSCASRAPTSSVSGVKVERRVLLGRHRGQAAGARRRHRRSDRNRLDAARQPAAHSRHGDGIEHAAHRQPDGARRHAGSAPSSRTSRCC